MTHGDASTIDQGSTRNDDDQKEQKTSEGQSSISFRCQCEGRCCKEREQKIRRCSLRDETLVLFVEVIYTGNLVHFFDLILIGQSLPPIRNSFHRGRESRYWNTLVTKLPTSHHSIMDVC